MIKITFNLDDPEGTRQVEHIGDEAESLDVYCRTLLKGFEEWAEEQGIKNGQKSKE